MAGSTLQDGCPVSHVHHQTHSPGCALSQFLVFLYNGTLDTILAQSLGVPTSQCTSIHSLLDAANQESQCSSPEGKEWGTETRRVTLKKQFSKHGQMSLGLLQESFRGL